MKEYSLDHEMRDGLRSVDVRPADGPISFPGAGSVLRIFKHSARAHMEERPTDRAHIMKSLRTLAAFSRFMHGSGIEWHMTGGIALDIIKKTSYRQHGDLDIVIPADQAESFGRFLSDAGIPLFRRVCTVRYYRDDRLTLFRRRRPTMSDFGKSRTLKIFMGPSARVLPVVDIHFVSRESGGCRILCDRKVEFVPFPLTSGLTVPVHGRDVSCCDLRLMLYMKCDANPRNFRDAVRISECLARTEVDRVLRLKHSPIPALGELTHTTGHIRHSFRIASTRR